MGKQNVNQVQKPMNQIISKPTYADSYRYIGRSLKNGWEKYGGRICTIGGTTGLFLSGIHASRKTYKVHDELVKNGELLKKAKEVIEGEKKTTRWLRIAKAEAKCALSCARHYWPDVVGGAVSAYATGKGWHKEHQHYQQAAAVVGVLAADFMNYRQNVIAEQGVEADRRYLTSKRMKGKLLEAEMEDGTKLKAVKNDAGETEGIMVSVDPNMFKIWYSRETTPMVWSEYPTIRMGQLETIKNDLNRQLIYGGQITVNDIRRQFYGVKGDVGAGGMFGRIWDPGNPEHPERGKLVNLHYEEDQDFMDGITDSCWIIIDVDSEPLFEILDKKQAENPRFTSVEMT